MCVNYRENSVGKNDQAFRMVCLLFPSPQTGTGVMTLQTQNVTSSCVTDRFLAIGDSEGAIRVHKLQVSHCGYRCYSNIGEHPAITRYVRTNYRFGRKMSKMNSHLDVITGISKAPDFAF